MEQIEDESVSSSKQARGEVDFTLIMKNPQKPCEKLTDTIEADIGFYGNIVQANAHPRLYAKLIDQVQDEHRTSFTKQGLSNEASVDIVVNYVVLCIIVVFHHWFSSGQREPIGNISSAISALTFRGINGVIRTQ
ncbi:MAG: TetR/AcrR family transcriptional regulator C-terminal domain-containing protein [Eubacteriales bacterium]|nr:TetR/AcrR family transcriptional regulator C-terminal domain-containing protein [Eubacteriales bacterium]